MSFNDEITNLENKKYSSDFIILKGNIPILFSAPHTMIQRKDSGNIKLNEPYTKAIALYIHQYLNTYAMVKIKDTGLDPNKDNHDEYKKELLKIVKEKEIKLVIDLHGSKEDRNFDIEFGTLNNLSADFSTIKELEKAFIENDIKNITHNTTFKGGAITQYLYNLKDVDVIQLEINRKYRDPNNLELLEKVIHSLMKFIIQYMNYTAERSIT